MMKVRLLSYVLFGFLLIIGCRTSYIQTQSQPSLTKIQADSLNLYDSATHYLIAPYKQQLDAQMNKVIGSTTQTLLKQKPEGTLCNLVTDASVWYASQHYEKPIDICVMNYGGIRIPSIQAGDITVGKIYELMPFDNELTILELNGATLLELLNMVAKSGGWPISGAKMQISSDTIQEILIRNKPIDLKANYVLLTSDYIANGGDNAQMLKKALSRKNLNEKVRDAIIDYIQFKKNLNIQPDGRISNKP